jgi:hypothetical protein
LLRKGFIKSLLDKKFVSDSKNNSTDKAVDSNSNDQLEEEFDEDLEDIENDEEDDLSAADEE